MAVKDYQARAVKKYQDANYEFIKVRLNKGEKEIIKAKADAENKSINQYIREKVLEGDLIAMNNNWREYLIPESDADERATSEEIYVVFEEDEKGIKAYNLCQAIFSDLEVAKKYAESIVKDEDIYVAKYNDYINGNYNYLAEFKSK